MEGIRDELLKLKLIQARVAEISAQLAIWNDIDEVVAAKLERAEHDQRIDAILKNAAAKLRTSTQWLREEEDPNREIHHFLHHLELLLTEWEQVTPEQAAAGTGESQWLDESQDARLDICSWFLKRAGSVLGQL